jgi:glucose-6-phosphate 1-dehydrogenase
LDAMQGDASLFARGDEIELSWALIDDILASWEQPAASPLTFYEQESWGPKEAEDLLSRQGRKWYQDCGMHHAERR